MLFQHFDWDLTHQVLFLYILPSHHMNLRDQPWKMLILWCRTDICSHKFSAKVVLMLGNPFLVPSLSKLNHISLCFIQINTKSPANSPYSLQGKQCFFWGHLRCFGPHDKFQHNIKISIITARVSRLSVSCGYAPTQSFLKISCFNQVGSKTTSIDADPDWTGRKNSTSSIFFISLFRLNSPGTEKKLQPPDFECFRLISKEITFTKGTYSESTY